MNSIDGTALVDPRAELGAEVEIGPYCVVGPDVKIGRGTRLIGRVCLMGMTTLGEFNTISQCVIGGDPQDTSFQGSPTRVEVGHHNVIREGVTIHRATEKEDWSTRLGSYNVLMVGSHVAHDCQLADRITLGTGSMLGGHVHVESDSFISSAVAVVHNVTVGTHSFVGEMVKITQDVPRYTVVDGNPSKVRRINVGGLKRNGIGKEAIAALHEAYRLIFRSRLGIQRAAELLEANGRLTEEVRQLLEFLQNQQAGRHGRARDRQGRP